MMMMMSKKFFIVYKHTGFKGTYYANGERLLSSENRVFLQSFWNMKKKNYHAE